MSLSAAGFVSSLVLAGLTLTVFHRNQYAGPEGAVMRYFVAVSERDQRAAARVVSGSEAAFLELSGAVDWLLRHGARPVVIDVMRNDDVAIAAVLFLTPRGAQIPWAWRLVQEDDNWVIDAEGTLNQFRGLSRIPNL